MPIFAVRPYHVCPPQDLIFAAGRTGDPEIPLIAFFVRLPDQPLRRGWRADPERFRPGRVAKRPQPLLAKRYRIGLLPYKRRKFITLIKKHFAAGPPCQARRAVRPAEIQIPRRQLVHFARQAAVPGGRQVHYRLALDRQIMQRYPRDLPRIRLRWHHQQPRSRVLARACQDPAIEHRRFAELRTGDHGDRLDARIIEAIEHPHRPRRYPPAERPRHRRALGRDFQMPLYPFDSRYDLRLRPCLPFLR